MYDKPIYNSILWLENENDFSNNTIVDFFGKNPVVSQYSDFNATWNINADGTTVKQTSQSLKLPKPPFFAVFITPEHPKNETDGRVLLYLHERRKLTAKNIQNTFNYIEEKGENVKIILGKEHRLTKKQTGFGFFDKLKHGFDFAPHIPKWIYLAIGAIVISKVKKLKK